MARQLMLGLAAAALLAAPAAAQQDDQGTVTVRALPTAKTIYQVRTPGAISLTLTGHGRIGVTVDLRPSANDSIGATVQGVTPGGPAAKAGIRSGDLIVRVNGTSLVEQSVKVSGKKGAKASGNDAITIMADNDDGDEPQSHPGLKLLDIASRLSAGDTVSIEYRRGKERKTVQLVAADLGGMMTWTRSGDTEPFFFQPSPGGAFQYGFRVPDGGDLPRVRGFNLDAMGPMSENRVFLRFGSPLGDMEFAPVNADLGRYFGVTDGILVLSVPDSAVLDLKPGDVILSVGDRKPTSVSKLLSILQTYDDSETVNLDVMRDHKHLTVSGKADWNHPVWNRDIQLNRAVPDNGPVKMEYRKDKVRRDGGT